MKSVPFGVVVKVPFVCQLCLNVILLMRIQGTFAEIEKSTLSYMYLFHVALNCESKDVRIAYLQASRFV